MSGGDQFNPPGRLLFRIAFNVDAATGAIFVRFIEEVVQRLRDLIQNPRLHGTRTMVLPPPQEAGRRAWFVIELQSRDREMRYSVPIFIEAETIYLRGYQNQHGDLFQFAGDNYLGGAATSLNFTCNYCDLQPRTKEKVKEGVKGEPEPKPDPGLVLEPVPDQPQQGSSKQRKDKKEEQVPKSPNFGQERLRVAVRELAEGRNPPGQSHHRTAQNLLLVIIRFCESIRNEFICAKMEDLWTVQSSTGQPSRCLSQDCFGQVKNWNKLAINLQNSARRLLVWPRILADKTGVRSPAEAKEKLRLVLYIPDDDKDKKEPNKPKWVPPPDDYNKNNNRRRHGGPGGGAAGGVAAAELPVTRWLPVPREPVMVILGVYVRRQPGLQGVYGTVTVDDGLGAQTIFRRSRVLFGRDSGDSKEALTLGLNTLHRPVSAADSCVIDIDLWSAPFDAQLSTGLIIWSICDFSSNTYDSPMRKTVGQAVVEYVVYSSAKDLTAVDDTADGITFELLGPGSSSAEHTSSSAGQHEHDELRRRRR